MCAPEIIRFDKLKIAFLEIWYTKEKYVIKIVMRGKILWRSK